jgi:hypothetical protein
MAKEFWVYLIFLFNGVVYLVKKYGYIRATCFNFKNLWIFMYIIFVFWGVLKKDQLFI